MLPFKKVHFGTPKPNIYLTVHQTFRNVQIFILSPYKLTLTDDSAVTQKSSVHHLSRSYKIAFVKLYILLKDFVASEMLYCLLIIRGTSC